MTRCQHKNLQNEFNCNQTVWSGSIEQLCLLHDPSPMKPAESVEKIIQEKIKKGDLFFEGCIFHHSVNFREMHFKEFTNFENCQFLGKECNFYKAKFTKGVLFNHSIFKSSRTNFSRVYFEGDFTLFNAVEFEGFETHFYDAHFNAKHSSFAGLKCNSHELSFKKAKFTGSVFFNDSLFNNTQLSFELCDIQGSLFTFSKSNLKGPFALWNQAQFKTLQVDFSETSFACDEVSFAEVKMDCPEISFEKCFFKNKTLSFQKAILSFDKLNFANCSFHNHEINFSEMLLNNGEADFSYVVFESKFLKAHPLLLENKIVLFNRAEFSGDEKSIYFICSVKTPLHFEGSYFRGGSTKLKGNLENSSFNQASLEQVVFDEAQWYKKSSRLICLDELNAMQENTNQSYKEAELVCRKIKKCYEQNGNYEKSSDFFYGEMECKRKTYSRQRQLGLQFMRLTCGYGEKPLRVIITSWFIITLCAFLYLYGGVQTPDHIINRDWAGNISQPFHFLNDFFNCVYFSVVSFTTLGYGDYHPVGWSRVVGASEGFMGAFFMSMYVLTIGRKLNR